MSRRLRIALGSVAATVVVAALGWFALVGPARSHAAHLAAAVDDAQNRMLALEAAQAHAPRGAARDVYALSRAMPTQDDMPGILLDLSRAAGATGLALTGVQPAARVTLTDGSSALPLTVAVQGSYPHITAFLRRLRLQVRAGRTHVVASGRLFVADQVTLTAVPGSPVTASLQLIAFDYAAPPSGVWTPGVSPTGTAGAEAAGATH